MCTLPISKKLSHLLILTDGMRVLLEEPARYTDNISLSLQAISVALARALCYLRPADIWLAGNSTAAHDDFAACIC